MQLSQPKAGDAVILTGDYTGVNPGDIACIGGLIAAPLGNDITFNPRSYNDGAVVSCGGGPGTFTLPELHPTGKTVPMTFWRFKNGIHRAHNDETFIEEVPLWEFRGEGQHPVWGAQSVEQLLSDRKKAFQPCQPFPEEWKEMEVYRGDYNLTGIPNRPSGDMVGAFLASLYWRRQLLTLIRHHVHPVGCGYWYTVTIGGTSYQAFRSLTDLQQWLSAYALKVVDDQHGKLADVSKIIPNADVDRWQPLRAEPRNA